MKVFNHKRLAALINECQNKEKNRVLLHDFYAKARVKFEDCDILDAYYTKTLIGLGFPKEFATVEYGGQILISKDDIFNAFKGSARYVGRLATGETVNEPVYLDCFKNEAGSFMATIWMKYNGNNYAVPALVDKISPLHAMFLIVSRELESGHLKFDINDLHPQDEESVELIEE